MIEVLAKISSIMKRVEEKKYRPIVCKIRYEFNFFFLNKTITNAFCLSIFVFQTHSSSNTLIYIRSYEYPTEWTITHAVHYITLTLWNILKNMSTISTTLRMILSSPWILKISSLFHPSLHDKYIFVSIV
jgi:hypothetical protein